MLVSRSNLGRKSHDLTAMKDEIMKKSITEQSGDDI
jgi:hypothetical protein